MCYKTGVGPMYVVLAAAPVERNMYAVQKRPFLSLTVGPSASLENLATQTLSKTQFDFDTFLANPLKPDIRAKCSIS